MARYWGIQCLRVEIDSCLFLVSSCDSYGLALILKSFLVQDFDAERPKVFDDELRFAALSVSPFVPVK